jgi:hypothetical protein
MEGSSADLICHVGGAEGAGIVLLVRLVSSQGVPCETSPEKSLLDPEYNSVRELTTNRFTRPGLSEFCHG